MRANTIHRGLIHLMVTGAVVNSERNLGRWAEKHGVDSAETRTAPAADPATAESCARGEVPTADALCARRLWPCAAAGGIVAGMSTPTLIGLTGGIPTAFPVRIIDRYGYPVDVRYTEVDSEALNRSYVKEAFVGVLEEVDKLVSIEPPLSCARLCRCSSVSGLRSLMSIPSSSLIPS